VDTHVDPPFRLDDAGKVRDRRMRPVESYPGVTDMLQSLHQQGYRLGVASRTGSVAEARQLIELFRWSQYLTDAQIYPGDKRTHFEKLQNMTGIVYKDMLFFDDEDRNIESVSKLGVTSVLVPDGMTISVLIKGLDIFAKC